jgi:hypothetical protein
MVELKKVSLLFQAFYDIVFTQSDFNSSRSSSVGEEKKRFENIKALAGYHHTRKVNLKGDLNGDRIF